MTQPTPTSDVQRTVDRDRLRAAIVLSGLSDRQVADRSGIPRGTLHSLLHPRYRATGARLGARWNDLADALGVDVDAITVRRGVARDARARGAA